MLYLLIALSFVLLSIALLLRNERLRPIIGVVYLIGIFYFVFLIREPRLYYRYSYILFNALREGIEFENRVLGNIKITSWESLGGIALNILLFIPFGFILPGLNRKAGKWWNTLLLGFGFSVIIELLQLFTRRGYADIDDICNNTILVL